jgi:hypothetical protein
MPVVSKAQGAYLGIHHPEVLRAWKEEGADTSVEGKPEHISRPGGPGRKRGRKRRRIVP